MRIVYSRGLQREVVYLGWPIAHSYMSTNAGGGELRGLSQWVQQLCIGAQINFDLNPYSTYGVYFTVCGLYKARLVCFVGTALGNVSIDDVFITFPRFLKNVQYNFVEVSLHNLESYQTWGLCIQHYKPFSNHFCSRGGGGGGGGVKWFFLVCRKKKGENN